MPLAPDAQNVVEVITLSNLANLTLPSPVLVIPAGLAEYFVTTVINHFAEDFGLAPDIQQLLKTLIITNQVTIISS